MDRLGIQLRGRVIHKRYAAGSKSDHLAVMLETPEGTYKLRRMGGNPFVDKTMDGLVGKEIEGTGNLHEGAFIVRDWKILSDDRTETIA